MSQEDELVRLGEAGAEAVAGALATFADATVERGPTTILGRSLDPLAEMPAPLLITTAVLSPAGEGGLALVSSLVGARRVAAAITGAAIDETGEDSAELVASAAGEAAAQVLGAAAEATGAALGEQLGLEPARTRTLAAGEGALDDFRGVAHVISTSFTIADEPFLLIQLLPPGAAAVAQVTPEGNATQAAVAEGEAAWLHRAKLRLVAELGRARLPVERVVGLGDGAVVALDRQASDPIDLYVNGTAFATGRLLLLDDGEWAVRIEELSLTA